MHAALLSPYWDVPPLTDHRFTAFVGPIPVAAAWFFRYSRRLPYVNTGS
jgi:hypothetical protein